MSNGSTTSSTASITNDTNDSKIIREFRKFNPSTFDGSSVDPTIAKNWITEIKTIFCHINIPEEQKVNCATFMLRVRYKKEMEFLNLCQENMLVAEYERKFDRLSHFVPQLVDTEEKKVERFIWGLREGVRDIVTAFRHKKYALALKLALLMEVNLAAKTSTFEREFIPNQKRKFNQQGFQRSQGKQKIPKALKATGQCLRNLGVCFNCGQTGHYAKACPKLITQVSTDQTTQPTSNKVTQQQKGWVFAITRKEAEDQDAIVILGYYAFSLFDLGSSHSFISTTFAQHAQLTSKPLGYNRSIATPIRVSMLAHSVVENCELSVSGHKLGVTLIILDISHFDIILGMDWLAANYASIDWHNKEVIFTFPTGTKFKFKRSNIRSAPTIILSLKTKHLLNYGAWACLSSVMDLRNQKDEIKAIPVIRKFDDIFPEELPGLPPNREIEFYIDLIPGAELYLKHHIEWRLQS
ncbi:uncharacterized protein LOC120072030 [Benincasa hispida]|uniref:uncharacterized protein LOC120072030 n=1 Tax=Benincasa hispida TaxID=102211 RepID=UPI001901B8A9|nr:uncharacterized protein LOC120072030 [Benincasa hispida]